jgi:excisionase family DNA binding protein
MARRPGSLRREAHHRYGELVEMKSQSPIAGGTAAQRPAAPAIVLLTAKEAAKLLKVSLSWLAKARMRGDGPPYIRIGRSIRYNEAALIQWMKSRQRLSTSEL